MRKKIIMLLICILTVSVLAGCSKGKDKKEEQQTAGNPSAPVEVSGTEVPETEEPDEDSKEVQASPQTEGNEENELKNEDAQDYEPQYVYDGNPLDWFDIGEIIDDEMINFKAPSYHLVNDTVRFLENKKKVIIVIGNVPFSQEIDGEGTLENVMAIGDEWLKNGITGRLNASYGYSEIVMENKDKATCSDIEFDHFTGYLKGCHEDGSSNKRTYYAEGYTRVFGSRAVFIMGIVAADNEDTQIDYYGEAGYAKKYKEELLTNLGEMMKTITIKDY